MWVKPRDHKIVGECLSAARKAAGVTQDQLAVRLAKPQSLISAYERGQRRIDLIEFLLIMDAINTDPQMVFARIVEQASPIVQRNRRPRRKRSAT